MPGIACAGREPVRSTPVRAPWYSHSAPWPSRVEHTPSSASTSRSQGRSRCFSSSCCSGSRPPIGLAARRRLDPSGGGPHVAETGTLGYAPGEHGAAATSYLWAALLGVKPALVPRRPREVGVRAQRDRAARHGAAALRAARAPEGSERERGHRDQPGLRHDAPRLHQREHRVVRALGDGGAALSRALRHRGLGGHHAPADRVRAR